MPTRNTTKMPRQRLPEIKKTDQWKKDTMEAIIAISDFSPGRHTQREDLRKAYEYYNGIIDDTDYTHVLRPYGKRRQNMPARLHNYPILKPVIDLLMGEKRRRPFNYTVVVANPDVDTLQSEERSKLLRENIHQHFANALADQGVETGEEEEGTPLPEKVQEAFNTSYRDARALRGQEAMDYLIYQQEIRSKLAIMWQHWLISGTAISLREIIGEEVIYEALNPVNVDFDKSEDTTFIEDADWAAVRQMTTRAKVIDYFYAHLTPDQIDSLENPKTSTGPFLEYQVAAGEETKDTKVEVIRVFWKAQKKIGIVTYFDENSELQEKEVPEQYQIDKEGGEVVEWLWVNASYKGTRIDEDIYVDMIETEVQHESSDNLSICKLPINGRRYSDLNSPNVSLLMLGIPYQLNYNIFKLRLETAIAKSKDFIAQLDINMIPAEWDMDKFMYFVDATGIAWVDYAKEGVKLNPQHQSVLDMTIKTIGDFITLLEAIKSEWEELAGVSRQRQGQIAQYDGRDTTQQAIVQSAMITEDLFAKFAELEQRDLQSLIDLTRYAWINGKKGMYVTSDMSQEILDIDGIQHMDAEYGIFVSDSARDQEKLDALQALIQPFIQNGAPMTTVIEMIEATNFVALKSKIKKAEESMAKLQQAQTEAEQAAIAEAQQFEQAKLEREDINAELDRQNKIQVAEIQANNHLDLKDMDVNRDGIPDNAQLMADEREQLRELDLKRDQMRQDKVLGTRKLDLEEKKIVLDAGIKRAAAKRTSQNQSKK